MGNPSVHAIAKLRTSQEKQAQFELYVAKDILQGERVPFYVIWKDAGIKRISLGYSGFTGISKFYNVRTLERTINGATVRTENLKVQGYLGGVLTTKQGPNERDQGTLKIELESLEGTITTLIEERDLYSVRTQLSSIQKHVRLPLPKTERPVRVSLRGAATTLIDIRQVKGSIELGIPNEVATAIERYASAVAEGLTQLKQQFPKYSKVLEMIVDEELAKSLNKYVNDIAKELRKYQSDEEFMQSLAYVFLIAFLEQESVRGVLLLPIMEYFEAGAAVKAFLDTPLVGAMVPRGGGRIRCTLSFRDLLGHRCGRPILIDLWVDSDHQRFVPLKDLIEFERI